MDDWTQMKFKLVEDKIPKVSCVYFLFNDNELVYIGQTKNLKQRIMWHKNYLNPNLYVGKRLILPDIFDSVYYLPVVNNRRERLDIEHKYLELYDPKCNWNGMFS